VPSLVVTVSGTIAVFFGATTAAFAAVGALRAGVFFGAVFFPADFLRLVAGVFAVDVAGRAGFFDAGA
jgi:hypothetical protein